MKSLKIGQISPLNLTIPPKKYGGTERIIYWLCQELPKRGHQVFLFGPGTSQVDCHLLPVIKKGLWEMKIKESTPYYAYEMALIAQKAEELRLDILHDHLGPWSLSLYNPHLKDKILHTLHIPFHNKDRAWAYRKLNAKLVSVSNEQRKPAPDLNYLATIYNGIDVETFPFQEKPKDYFFWAGELSPRKGIYEVIRIAKLAKLKLILAGRIPPKQQSGDYHFFNKYIAKHLNKNNILYVGELYEKDLKKYYKNAIAFLNPLQWKEPFGLTTIESMACGTPVIAFRRGSMAEIIKHKRTGFLVQPTTQGREVNYKDFIAAIKKIGRISRKDCRKWVEGNFTIKKMVDEYEKVYYKISAKK